MENRKSSQDQLKKNLENVLTTAVEIIKNPIEFYKKMPKSGGFVEPLIFMVVLGIISGLVQLVLSIFGIGFGGTFFAALVLIITAPIFIIISGFAGAAILFVIWKIMGSQESYEVAFRCCAYMAAISPITTLVNTVPYLGSLVVFGWMTYFLVIASTEVHKLKNQTSWIVFGIIGTMLALNAINAQIAARKLQKGMEKWQSDVGEMTPEEAGRALGEFFKGIEQSTREEKKL